MSLILEDGTGLVNSNSYADVAEADAYFLSRNISSWDLLTTEAKESALITATEYVDLAWGSRFKGRPLQPAQSLEFPRSNCYSRYGQLIEGVPSQIKQAVSLYALYSTSSSLWANNSSQSSKEVKKKRVVVGPITTETEYTEGQRSDRKLYFPQADALMEKFLLGGSGNGGVIRN